MRAIIYEPPAIVSLAETMQYIEGYFGRKRADTAQKNYEYKLLFLALNPEVGRTERGYHGQNLRSYLLHENTRVYYTYTDTAVNVLLFWGTHQHPDKLEALLGNV